MFYFNHTVYFLHQYMIEEQSLSYPAIYFLKKTACKYCFTVSGGHVLGRAVYQAGDWLEFVCVHCLTSRHDSRFHAGRYVDKSENVS